MKSEFFARILSSIILIPILLFFIIKGGYLFNYFILICLLISIYEWIKMTNKKVYKIPGVIFLISSFFSVYYLRNKIPSDYTFFIMTLFICIFTDIGGYLFGKLFKGPKLTKISPKKTYAGAVGGYFFSLLFIFFFFNYAEYISDITILEFSVEKISVSILILTLLISSISQLGDICVSYFKRKSNIKNTGNLIPGHGGLLDRIDGMIFAFPITSLIIKIFF